MANTKKIAISLPGELVQTVERLRKHTGKTRSAFIKRTIELALKKRAQKALIARYLEGYRKQPETVSEIAAAEVAATHLFAGEPWE